MESRVIMGPGEPEGDPEHSEILRRPRNHPELMAMIGGVVMTLGESEKRAHMDSQNSTTPNAIGGRAMRVPSRSRRQRGAGYL